MSRIHSIIFELPLLRLVRPQFIPLYHRSLLRSPSSTLSRTAFHTFRIPPKPLRPFPNKSRLQCVWPPRISLSIQLRHYARRRPKEPIITSFPQFTPRPLKPL